MDYEEIYKNFPEVYSEESLSLKNINYNFFLNELSKNFNLIDGDLIDFLIEKTIYDISLKNQFIVFLKEDISKMRKIFVDFFNKYGDIIINKKKSQENHIKNILLELINNILKIIENRNGKILKLKENETIINENYSAEFQIELLKIDLENIKEPVLDIGCGQNGNLVKYMRLNGIEAFGIDICFMKFEWYEKANWLYYDYGIEKWGTIISNMAFSNHYNYHIRNLNKEICNIYNEVFNKILNSLKIKGEFIYSPEINGIDFLITQPEKFEKFDFPAGNTNRLVSIIRKIY